MVKFFGIFFFGVTIAVTYGAVINTKTFVDSNNLFAFNILDTIFQNTANTGKSFIFSPYSIRTAAALLYEGAGGLTATQMMNGFEFESDKSLVGDSYKDSIEKLSKDSLFTVANKIYLAKGETIAPKFLEIATNNFYSEVENIEFTNSDAAAQNINQWVNDKTHGKIKELVKPETMNKATKMLAINAIYFRGEWETEFEKGRTQMEDFYTKPGETVKVEMMHVKTPVNFVEIPEYGIKLGEFPFKGNSASMFFLAPLTPDKDLLQIQHFLRYLVYDKDIFNKLKYESCGGLSLPKFKIDFDFDCLESFTKMGIDKLSGPESNFDNILSPPQPMHLSKFKHKATIEINEEAAEAAAITEDSMEERMGCFNYKEFKFNQSFLYFIRGKNGQIYFMGKYTGK